MGKLTIQEDQLIRKLITIRIPEFLKLTNLQDTREIFREQIIIPLSDLIRQLPDSLFLISVFDGVIDKDYGLFGLTQENLQVNEIARGHLYSLSLFADPSSDNEFERLKNEVYFYHGGSAKLIFYKQINEHQINKLTIVGQWQNILKTFFVLIINTYYKYIQKIN